MITFIAQKLSFPSIIYIFGKKSFVKPPLILGKFRPGLEFWPVTRSITALKLKPWRTVRRIDEIAKKVEPCPISTLNSDKLLQ